MSPIDYLYYLCFVFFAFGGSFFFKKGIVATKFLGLLFIVLGLQTFLNYYIRPEYLLQYPHFFRTVSPLMLTIGPLYYLFQQYLLYPERKLKPALLWHFLPFALHVIEYIPFYLLPAELKILEIKEMISENTLYTIHSKYGWITMRTHIYIRFTSFFIYVSLSFIDLLKYYLSSSKSFIKNNQLGYLRNFGFWFEPCMSEVRIVGNTFVGDKNAKINFAARSCLKEINQPNDFLQNELNCLLEPSGICIGCTTNAANCSPLSSRCVTCD